MDIAHRKSSVLVSPVRTLAIIMALTGARAAAGAAISIAMFGIPALPLLIPGIPAIVASALAARKFNSFYARLGLCMSAAMWVGVVTAIVENSHSESTVFLAGAVASFAVADVLFGTMSVRSAE